MRSRCRDWELEDSTIIGHAAFMVDIDTRTTEEGRYFTPVEEERGTNVRRIGSRLVEEFFPGVHPFGRVIRLGKKGFTVIGTNEKVGAILGQEEGNFTVIPIGAFRRLRRGRLSVT